MRTSPVLVLLACLSAPALAQTPPAAPTASAAPATPVAVAQMARPRSVNDCESVKGDLAYNQCLSMFGPAAHTKGGSVAAGSGDGPAAAAAAAPAQEVASTRRGRRGRVLRRGGRHGASFTVGHGGGQHGSRRRRHR